jgi:hypothetical protein
MAGPLAGKGGIPILGKEDSDTHFVGRVVLDLFEGPKIRNDAAGFAMVISPALASNLSQQDFLKRIATALSDHVALQNRTRVEPIIPDPLAEKDGVPMVSREDSESHYVGHIIIELFESPKIRNDADGLTMIIRPSLTSNLSQEDLLKRIAAALPGRVALNERSRIEQITKEAIQQQERLHS